MVQPWQTGKVIRIEDETANTRRFWIELPSIQSFEFRPGQFVTIDLPIDEKPARRWRSYSIASWPDGSNTFELVIVLLEGGSGTQYLFNQVRVGTELTLRGPQGVFVLPESLDSDLFFICTGTGIAPFRAMAHDIYNKTIPHKDIYLIFGCRKFNDALYRKELEELQSRMPGFHYIPVFSREIAEENEYHTEAGQMRKDTNSGSHRTGYVHAVYEEICKWEKNGSADSDKPALKPASFYLCGWKNMIDEAKKRIQELGYDRKAIHQELYG